jgi:hypothetical protein
MSKIINGGFDTVKCQIYILHKSVLNNALYDITIKFYQSLIEHDKILLNKLLFFIVYIIL